MPLFDQGIASRSGNHSLLAGIDTLFLHEFFVTSIVHLLDLRNPAEYLPEILQTGSVFTLLGALGLKPLEWTAVIEATENPAPHISEILKAGFRIAQAAIVLFTPDDEARLRAELRKDDDPPYESELYPQPRLNVIFEPGMAMALFPNQTVFVQVGTSRPFSDIAGIHYVKMDNTIGKRKDFARRLKMAGCKIIDLELSTEWQTAGDFSLSKSATG